MMRQLTPYQAARRFAYRQQCRAYSRREEAAPPPPTAVKESIPPNGTVKLLVITDSDSGAQYHSTWRVVRNQWTCIQADNAIEWHTRIRNLDTVMDWLQKMQYRFQWLTTHNHVDCGSADKTRSARETPAEATAE